MPVYRGGKRRKPYILRKKFKFNKISNVKRMRTRELLALGAIFIFGLIMLVLIVLLLYNSFFTVKISLKDVSAMKIAPKELTYIYEICQEQQKNTQHVLTTYLIYNRFFKEKQTAKTKEQLKMDFFPRMDAIRKRIPEKQYNAYFTLIETITTELKYFPVPIQPDYGEGAYMYGDTWSAKKEMCGTNNHMGCDIFDRENIPGRLRVVSMTGGVIESRGKNGRGAMYVGVRTERGLYCLYDNLEKVNDALETGAAVLPGTLIGYMGNGTKESKSDVKGYFPTNVHIGIKVKSPVSKNDFWINPYPFLRLLEDITQLQYEV